MAKTNSGAAKDIPDMPVSLEEGISLIETGQADACIRIDFGDGIIGSASEPDGLDGLLQRARGLRLIKVMGEQKPVERPAHMRKHKAALHPTVEEILDALRQAD